MKKRIVTKTRPMIAVVLLVSSFILDPSSARAQGALTPTGPPAPTMKSLDQIEPRTPISSAPFTINTPGAYYLTTNVAVGGGNAITVVTNGVMLDLNGFTISSTAASATGTAILLQSDLRNITVLNGFIQGGVTNNGSGTYNGGGFANGITYDLIGNAPANVRVSGVSVSGCLNHGFFLIGYNSTLVESCTVHTAGGYGIVASTVRNCVAFDCGTAINCDQASDCLGQSGANGDGIDASTAVNCSGYCSGSGAGISATTALNCSGSSESDGVGISVTAALNCSGSSGSGNGISATTVENCNGFVSSSGAGVSAQNAQNCYGTSNGSGYGLYATYTAISCQGYCSSGIGLFARTAAFCTGYRFGGTAIQATVANGCSAVFGTNNVTFKYNMP